MVKSKKKGLLLLAVGAVCGALCYRLIQNKKKDEEDILEDDFDDFGDDFVGGQVDDDMKAADGSDSDNS